MKNPTLVSAVAKDGLLAMLAAVSRAGAELGPAAEPGDLQARLQQRLGDAKAAAFLLGCSALHEYLTADIVDGSNTIDEEAAAVAASRRALLPAFQCRVQERIDRADAATAGHLRCAEHACALHSQGRRQRSWLSTLGALQLKRRASQCVVGGEARSPAERAVGLPAGNRTARCDEIVTAMATTVPHGMAERLLHEFIGIDVSEHAIQDAVEERALAVIALESAAADAANPLDAEGRERHPQRPSDAVRATEAPRIAYLETDGVLPMTRELDPERCVPAEPGARGGQGKRYTLEGREVKNAVLYTEGAQARESPSRGCLLAKTYVSWLGHWRVFALHLWLEMLRLRFDEAQLLVVLGDGATWIASLVEWLPKPMKILHVLDFYHAAHRVWEVAHAVHGAHAPAAATWAREQCARLETGQAQLVIDGLRFLKTGNADTQKKIDELSNYFTNNLKRMNYPEYVARGLRITSGKVESANYHVTGARLKCQGMRWAEAGAAQMALLRADLFNERWAKRTRQVLAAA